MSKHHIQQQDIDCLTNVTKKNGPTVYLTNIEAIQTTHVGLLPHNKSLSKIATTANVLPNLQSASLISLGQLCDDNCDVTLNKTLIKVLKNNQNFLQGERNHNNGLWDIPIPISIQPKQQSMSVII